MLVRSGLSGLLLVTLAVACRTLGADPAPADADASAPDGAPPDGSDVGDAEGGAGDGATDDGDVPPPCLLPPLTSKVATLGGCETPGTNDGVRGTARFSNPTNTLIGTDGVTYVSDFDSDRLRAVDPTGATRTVVKKPEFRRPFGMALAPNGNLYVETDDNDSGMRSNQTGTIWLVDPKTGSATVLARDLGRPRGLAVLGDGRIAMADYQHHVVSIFDPTNASITPLAGTVDASGYVNDTGAAARFAQPYDLVLLPDGDLVVTDQGNHRMRRVTLAGVVTDFAGSGEVGNDDGALATATFDAPQGLAIRMDTLYVTDVHRFVVRKIEAGQVVTIAGDGTGGWLDAEDPRAAKFFGLEGLDVDATRIVVADGNGGFGSPFHRIRVIHLP
jgi:sugar lactone lactonase YvrE